MHSMNRAGRSLILAGSLIALSGCMVDAPLGAYQSPYARAPSGQVSGAPLVLAPPSLPGGPVPLGPPISMEPLAPPPGSPVSSGIGQDDQLAPRMAPDDDGAASLQPAMPAPLDNLPSGAADVGQDNGLTPTLLSPPPVVNPPVAATDTPAPSIDDQLAAIKASLSHDASAPPPPPANPRAHERYGGLSRAGDVSPPSAP